MDGVNLKLLKTGGLSQALLMAQVAQKKGLDLMVGCYSDSSLLNGAAAQHFLIRWPDLDSHQLVNDPCWSSAAGRSLAPCRASGWGFAMREARQRYSDSGAAGISRDAAGAAKHGAWTASPARPVWPCCAIARTIVAVIDPDHAGQPLQQITGIERTACGG